MSVNSIESIIEQQRQGWDAVSKEWYYRADALGRFENPIKEAIIEALNLQDGQIIIDMGTGAGDLGLEIARRNRTITVEGIDFSSRMVDFANNRAMQLALGNYSARKLDIATERLPFSEGSLDGIGGKQFFQFLPQPEKSLLTLATGLKPGGRMVMAVWGEPGENPWFTTAVGQLARILELPAPQPNKPHIARFAKQGLLAEVFQGIGLIKVQEVKVGGVLRVGSPEEYFDLISSVAPPMLALRKATEDQYKRVKDAILEASLRYTSSSGGLELPSSAWVVSGVKS